ncbi:Phosphoenolpyruvate carboxylase 2 [Camellia lanceoleosa]|uniref:Phosphoenolpyruvate carboxylase 2 n=1 Tax=Camellia lanceoleosa TaxID=1840588 RepID=A0ACC0FC13_9ERIC|nr:Phosphoenolpyruvate carboxylase 2 [Camellia lanceoleosa]
MLDQSHRFLSALNLAFYLSNGGVLVPISDRHTDVMDAITKHLEIGSYREWSEERRQEWLLSELSGKCPLFGPDLPKTEEIANVLDTFGVLAELPSDCFGAYIISIATSLSDVLMVHGNC